MKKRSKNAAYKPKALNLFDNENNIHYQSQHKNK